MCLRGDALELWELLGQDNMEDIIELRDEVIRVIETLNEVISVNNELFHIGLITSTGGNISARIPGRENEIWITPSGIYKGSLLPELLTLIDIDGEVLAGDFPASSERLMHCAILNERPEIGAVIHTHAPQAANLVLAELPFLPISTEAASIGDIPRIPFFMPGTPELGKAVVEALGKGVAVFMQNHGLVVAGRNLRQAADYTQIIEQTAEKILTCYALGKEPPVLPKDVVEDIRGSNELVG